MNADIAVNSSGVAPMPGPSILSDPSLFSSGMLTYKDLVNDYVASEGRRIERWCSLQRAATTFVEALEVSLKLESPIWMDQAGCPQRFVSIGVVRDGRFEVVESSALPGADDLTLNFAVRLCLQRAPSVVPTQAFVVPLELQQWDLLYDLQICCRSRPQFVVPVESGREGYAGAAEGIKQWISLSLKQHDAASLKAAGELVALVPG